MNVGTAWHSPTARAAGTAGRAGSSSAEGAGRGGVAVVLQGRESQPHGQGRQHDGKEDAAMPEEAPVNTGAPWPVLSQARERVLGMQAKLHQWAAADGNRPVR